MISRLGSMPSVLYSEVQPEPFRRFAEQVDMALRHYHNLEDELQQLARYPEEVNEEISAGKYVLERETTVIKAIATAGGATEKAAVNNTKVVRETGGRKAEIKLKMTDPVVAGDTIKVPQSFF